MKFKNLLSTIPVLIFMALECTAQDESGFGELPRNSGFIGSLPTSYNSLAIIPSGQVITLQDSFVISTPETKTDTILVGIACEIEGYVGMVSDFTMLKKCRLIEVRNVYQERTLEWRESGKSYWVGRDSLMTWWLPSQYTPIETKWLDPIEGCYKLIKLE